MGCRVLIVDDHAPFRSWAQRLLESDGYDVVGAAADASTGVVAACTLQPDVALVDVQLPDRSGFDVSAELAAGAPTCRVVLISTRTADAYGGRIPDAHAVGFLNKSDLSGAALADLLDGVT